MTARASLVADPRFVRGEVDRRLYGALIEHVGRCVHTGIYEPGHPEADELGFREDVLELMRSADFPVYRYPGGCYASVYRWEDGIGPVADRPTRLELAWRALETNAFGLDEFVQWAARAGGSPYLVVNTATRDLLSAAAMVEYCNHPRGSAYSDLRVAHGFAAPHDVRLWGIDNEQDGPWEIGYRSAADYGRLAFEAAKIMRRVDPTIEIVAAGSSGPELRTFPEWDRVVLEHAYETVDYIAPHMYLGDFDGDLDGYLAQSIGFDQYLATAEATCDYARAQVRSKKTMRLCVDEWNVWYHTRDMEQLAQYQAGADPVHHDTAAIEPWSLAPPLMEEVYTAADAVVVGAMLIVLLRHADRVKVACLSTAINNVGAIMTAPGGPAWAQTIFYPFMHASAYGRGTVLDLQVRSDRHTTSSFGDVALVDAVATDDGDDVTIFAVNRGRSGPTVLHGDVRGLGPCAVREHLVLSHADPYAVNTQAQPLTVQPRADGDAEVGHDGLAATLPPLSWNVIRLRRVTG